MGGGLAGVAAGSGGATAGPRHTQPAAVTSRAAHSSPYPSAPPCNIQIHFGVQDLGKTKMPNSEQPAVVARRTAARQQDITGKP